MQPDRTPWTCKPVEAMTAAERDAQLYAAPIPVPDNATAVIAYLFGAIGVLTFLAIGALFYVAGGR